MQIGQQQQSYHHGSSNSKRTFLSSYVQYVILVITLVGFVLNQVSYYNNTSRWSLMMINIDDASITSLSAIIFVTRSVIVDITSTILNN